MAFRMDNRHTGGVEKVKFFKDGLAYIRYCLLKELGEDISVDILRKVFDYGIEFIVNILLQKKALTIFNFGIFYTKNYPECVKRINGGRKVFIPAFESPAINFSKSLRENIRAGVYPCSCPEFLEAKPTDYQYLYHSVRVLDYNELNIEEAFDDEALEIPVKDSVELDKGFSIDF